MYLLKRKIFSNQQIVNDDVVFRLKALAQFTMRTAKVQQQVFEEENNQYDFLKYKIRRSAH